MGTTHHCTYTLLILKPVVPRLLSDVLVWFVYFLIWLLCYVYPADTPRSSWSTWTIYVIVTVTELERPLHYFTPSFNDATFTGIQHLPPLPKAVPAVSYYLLHGTFHNTLYLRRLSAKLSGSTTILIRRPRHFWGLPGTICIEFIISSLSQKCLH